MSNMQILLFITGYVHRTYVPRGHVEKHVRKHFYNYRPNTEISAHCEQKNRSAQNIHGKLAWQDESKHMIEIISFRH
jgi:hypothetical protein